MVVKRSIESASKETLPDSLWSPSWRSNQGCCVVPGEVKESCPLGWSCRGADGKAPHLRAGTAHEGESLEIKLWPLLSPFCLFFFFFRSNAFKTVCKWLVFVVGFWNLKQQKKIWKIKQTATKSPQNSYRDPEGFINPHVQSWGHFS